MVTKHKESNKKSPTILPEEIVTYLDFAFRLRRSYKIIQKIENYHIKKESDNVSNL